MTLYSIIHSYNDGIGYGDSEHVYRRELVECATEQEVIDLVQFLNDKLRLRDIKDIERVIETLEQEIQIAQKRNDMIDAMSVDERTALGLERDDSGAIVSAQNSIERKRAHIAKMEKDIGKPMHDWCAERWYHIEETPMSVEEAKEILK